MIILFISCPLVFNHHDYLPARKHIFFIHQSQRSRDRTFLETNKQTNAGLVSHSMKEQRSVWCDGRGVVRAACWARCRKAGRVCCRQREGGGESMSMVILTPQVSRIKCVSRSKSLGWHPVVVWVTCSHIRSLPTCPEATRTPSKAPFTIHTWY